MASNAKRTRQTTATAGKNLCRPRPARKSASNPVNRRPPCHRSAEERTTLDGKEPGGTPTSRSRATVPPAFSVGQLARTGSQLARVGAKLSFQVSTHSRRIQGARAAGEPLWSSGFRAHLPAFRNYCDISVRTSVLLLILAVRSSLSQLKGLPSMARKSVLASTSEKSWR